MAFVDANHSEDPTWRYFETIMSHRDDDFCMIVFDDIYWSEGMTKAWNRIAADPRVMTSIELPQMGIAIWRRGCQKEHYMLRF